MATSIKYGLVNAVRVEPVAAATSFAWKASMAEVEVRENDSDRHIRNDDHVLVSNQKSICGWWWCSHLKPRPKPRAYSSLSTLWLSPTLLVFFNFCISLFASFSALHPCHPQIATPAKYSPTCPIFLRLRLEELFHLSLHKIPP
jgi:hypothetical protein